MNIRGCLGAAFGLSLIVGGLYLWIEPALRTYRECVGFPSPTGVGSLVQVIYAESDAPQASFVVNRKFGNGEPVEIQHPFLSNLVRWSKDGAVFVADDMYAYDFRARRGYHLPLEPKTNRRAIERLLREKGGGRGYVVDISASAAEAPPHFIAPRHWDVGFWEQYYWAQYDKSS